ncbi:hypothetical protein LCGC14_1521740 [marine sediment metagenome]|uniref:Uncharacterized protein n=1 Tax=marine sediment metagenome TaxID=412755 RepID=A0A0F9LZH9_9ZZZZ
MNSTIDYNIQASIFGSLITIFFIITIYPCFWTCIDLRGDYLFWTLIQNVLMYSFIISLISIIITGIIFSTFNLWPFFSALLWIIITITCVTILFLAIKIHEHNEYKRIGDLPGEQENLMCDRCFKYNDCSCCSCCS